MSFHHENVIWQSPDGTWSRGFFTRLSWDSGDPDYDPEWDDSFDHNEFQFVSTGHPSEESAHQSWGGSNPGGHTVYAYCVETADEIEQFEDLAAKKYESEASQPNSLGIISFGKPTTGYHGPPKPRSLQAVKRERDALVETWASDHVGGYYTSIGVEELREALDQRIDRMLSRATEQERMTFEDQDSAHRTRLEHIVSASEQTRAEQAGGFRRLGLLSRKHGGEAVRRRSAEDGLREEINASADAARKRKNAHNSGKTEAARIASTGSPGVGNRARQETRVGACGRTTRSGKPCQNSSNCPAHRR